MTLLELRDRLNALLAEGVPAETPVMRASEPFGDLEKIETAEIESGQHYGERIAALVIR